MTTSGTVGQTSLDVATVLEHAFRRAKVHPSKQTPETLSLAKQLLYLLLTHLSNDGLNLWCVEQGYVGLTANKATYNCPTGTVDLLNLVYSMPSRITGTDTVAADSISTQLTTATTVQRIGVKFSSLASAMATVTFAHSADGATWTTISTHTKTDWAVDTFYWFALDPSIEDEYFKVSFTSGDSLAEFYLADSVTDLPVEQWSRDTFSVLNNKTQLGRPSTSYYFEKLITPRITLWPVPTDGYDHLTMFYHRQVQDIGASTNTIEIPARWAEAVIWQLASRLMFELPDADDARATVVMQMAEKTLKEVANEESDGAPLFLSPQIGVYTQ